jgi:hypothetical protein
LSLEIYLCFAGKQTNIPKLSARERREHQEKYKKYIIHDFSCRTSFIPPRVHPILVTDWMRFLFKHTKRMVLTSIERGGYDNSDVTPAECLHDLHHLNEGGTFNIIAELDRILYHASEIHEMGHGCDYENMINQNLEDIINFSSNINVDVLCDEEKIISLPTTKRIEDNNKIHIVNVEHNFCSCQNKVYHDTCEHLAGIDANVIKIGGSNREIYYLNVDKKTCTCLGFKHRGDCKHVRQRHDYVRPKQ